MRRADFLAASAAALSLASAMAAPARAASAIRIGTLPPGANDAITDVAGVLVGHVTKIEGAAGPLVAGKGPVRTGVTAIVPNADVWMRRVAAATYDLNGNGELTGAHWVDESGFLETPIAFTNTLSVPRVDDGVLDWMIRRWPAIGVSDDVPLPVVAECDDQGLNDIQGRHVSASDAVRALDAAATGQIQRGNVGAGTGMRAFGFKGGIGSASRRVSADANAATVGVLLNANTGSRTELRIDGVPVGRLTARELLPVFPPRTSYVEHGRAADGSIVGAIATDAPLDARQLRQLCKRAVLGLARTGITSHVSSGDLLVAFSTTRLYPREGAPLPVPAVYDDRQLDALFSATAEAAEAAVVDALLSARTLSGARGITFYALPEARVRELLKQ
ncbi:MAG: P1 family peptidase [Candidatus Eremiobacteraeota bacterium]|nr:P1 family peptidase [Candidatus Eremiobacteraeota bacterium]